jgi:hypothetical protein
MRGGLLRFPVAVLLVVLALHARAEDKVVRGRVTYLAAGTVYTSLGRDAGVRDSTILYVVVNKDTTATLQISALSSKSSACAVIRVTRAINIDDEVICIVPVVVPQIPDTSLTASAKPGGDTRANAVRSMQAKPAPGPVNVQGRIGAQYYTTMYDNSAFNIAEPGVVLNLRAAMRDVPLKFEMYANMRSIAIGNVSPFGKSAVNQSRVYGLSLSYDDGSNFISVGRVIPLFSPSIGYVDGALLSKRFGSIVVGTTLGYQPDYSLSGVTTDFRKLALFAQYTGSDPGSFSLSTAYARTYYHASLDREVASVLMNATISQNFYLYANGEMDFRRKSGDQFTLSPKLTDMYINCNYRFGNALNVGVGMDAARSYYSFESVRAIPDSLLFNDLRWGMTLNVSVFLPGGIGLFETFTPRSSDGPFGRDYSNLLAFNFSNILASGVNLRPSMTLNSNQYTDGKGFGIYVQKTFGQTIDLSIRWLRNSYTVKQVDQRNESTTLGCDVMLFITRSLSFLLTYDRLDGYGQISHSIFAEFGLRF